MLHITFTVLCIIGVHGIGGFGIDMVQPCGNHSQAPQFPPVLMRNQIIIIVFSDFFIFKGTEGDSLNVFAGCSAYQTVFSALKFAYYSPEVFNGHEAVSALFIGEFDIVAKLQNRWIKPADKVFGHKISCRIKKS